MTRAALWTPGDSPQEGAKATGLYLPGVSGNGVLCAYSSTFNSIVDFDIRVKVYLNNDGTNRVLIGRFYSAYDWRFYVDANNTLRFQFYPDGTASSRTLTCTAALPSMGVWRWCRVVFEPDSGDGLLRTRFYISDDGEIWSQLGNTIIVDLSGETVYALGTEPIIIGASGTLLHIYPASGAFARAEVRSGIGGPIVAQWDGSVPHERQVDPRGNVWTVNGTANAWQEV